MDRMGDFDKTCRRCEAGSWEPVCALMPEGREEVGVSGGIPLGPEIPGVPFSSGFSKGVEAGGRGRGHLPVRTARAVFGPPACSASAAPALSPAAPAASLARDPPPPAVRARLPACLPACGLVLLRVPVRSRPSPALRSS